MSFARKAKLQGLRCLIIIGTEGALAKAVEICPDAEKLMGIVAYFAPERIPLALIVANVMSEGQRDRAVAALYQLSLLTHVTTETGARAITLHRLVQEVMRSRLGHG